MKVTRLSQFISRHYKLVRLAFLLLSDAFVVFFAVVVAIFLYTRALPLPYTWPVIFAIAGVLLGIQVASFSLFRVYSVSFQYANLLLAVKIVVMQGASLCVAFYLLNWVFPGLWPLLVAILDGLLATAGAVFLRICGLIYLEVGEAIRSSSKQVLVYGAGETGQNVALALKNQQPGRHGRVKLIGFLDDDPRLRGKIIYGQKVLGDLGRLERILVQHEVDEVMVAIPSLSGERFRALRKRCGALNIAVKAIPSFYEVYNKKPEDIAQAFRDVELEDLLRRPKQELPLGALQEHFREKRVLVTGGGGSIGFELTRQLLLLGCARVIVADASEFNLSQVEERLGGDRGRLALRLVDAKDRDRLGALFAEYSPQVVFCAAAYKHVDLVESNPVEGVINNLASMKNAADLAHAFGCEEFIYVSSDKAVRPAGVMGATKRVGELYVQALNARAGGRFFAVRFGNVIGSSGSLIPKVVARIQRGESVQITHPDMTRYFMLLPEAVALILTASLHARGGEIFILDMGQPVRIVDLVNDLILLLERQPGKDVPIEFTGPRPGEKMHEELFIEGVEQQQRRDGFFVSTGGLPDFKQLREEVEGILEAGRANRVDEMLGRLRRVVRAEPGTRLPGS